MFKLCSKFHKTVSKVRLFATLVNKEMKYLNVAEKNDAAKTIAGLLSNGSARRREGLSVYNKIYEFETPVRGTNSKMVMTSVSGHLLQLEFLLSYRNWKNCEPLQLFDAVIRKSCIEDFLPIKKTLEREIKSCHGLIIWTDCDREGENIGFEIIEVCKAIKPNIPVYRAKFSEITTAAVRRALANLAQPDKFQNDAVNVRSELDLRTGAAITRLQTMRLQRLFPEKIANKLISYGSCQIPTLGFVAERYKEVEAFVSEPFWKIKVTHTIDDLTVDFNWARNRLFDKESCEDYLMLCLADPKAKVENVTTKPKNKWRPTPMDTVEMEKLGSRKLKLSAKETMTIAEKLYTQGIISYPRTETNMFSKEIDLKQLVEQQLPHSVWGDFAQRVLDWGTNPRNGNKSDQAHPPIHPTKLVTNLSGNEGRVYELIVRHFLACVSKDATGSETVVNIDIAGEKFTATGLCIYERNYLDVYIYEKWNAKQIHKYEIGQIFDPTEISMQEGATTAPPLLTEADLIALMEKHGIGTDATHAEHINTIKERGYIGEADRGCLVPGVIGMGLYEGYDAMELALAKPMLRAEFEADLKKICLGQKDPQAVLRDQIQKYKEAYRVILSKITAMDEKMALRINETPQANSANDETNANENQIRELFKCPKCNVSPMALRKKKDSPGFFIGCLNFPDCKNAVWLSDELKEVSATQDNCRHCGESSKMLKVKLSGGYYRSVFDVPDGWYTTCLLCDNKFRQTFNINVDLVKRVGAIVGDATSSRSGTHENQVSNSASGNGTRTNSSSVTSSRNEGGGQNSSKTKHVAPKKTNKKSTKTVVSADQQPTVRTFLTDARQTMNREPVNHVEDFFGSDDDFDNILGSADLEAAIAEEQSRITTTTGNENDDAVALLLNDDADDFNWGTVGGSNDANRDTFGGNNNQNMAGRRPNSNWDSGRGNNNSNWGTSGQIDDTSWGTSARSSYVTNVSTNKRLRVDSEESYEWGSQGNSRVAPPCTDNAWGSQNRPTGSRQAHPGNSSRPVPTPRTEESYEWGSSGSQGSRPHPLSTSQRENNTVVKCTGCHQLAKQLVVRKEGPNIGRPFYACPKPNACKFFQWADESSNADARTSQYNPSHTESSNSRTVSDFVKCNCKKAASSLIVRKDGPNQGRSFYACADRNKSCGFFKWNDDNDDDRIDQSSSWGTRDTTRPNSLSAGANRPSTSSRTDVNSQNDTKKRKCGLCRQEGHTRSKCPRKAEFEI